MNARNTSDDIAYKLLDAIGRGEDISQRALADRLGIALGLVNAYIKRLCGKGCLKVKFLPRNRIRYIITPRGFAEKTRLAYKYMHYSMLYFRDVRQRIEQVYAVMQQQGIRRVLLWGEGELAELCYISTRGQPLQIIGAVGKARQEREFFGRHVYTVDDLPGIDYDAILIATLDEHQVARLKGMGLGDKKIFYLGQ
jgi:DNA-binding MarR family transcriptional regulator